MNGTDYAINFSREIGGVIRCVGLQVNDLKAGDRVVGFNFDKFSMYQRVPASHVKKIKNTESLKEAVAVVMAYGTAFYGITSLAQVEPDNSVLFLQGIGLPGLAAIRITQIFKGSPLSWFKMRPRHSTSYSNMDSLNHRCSSTIHS